MRATRARANRECIKYTKKICSETFHPLVQMQLTKRRKNSIFTFVIRLGGVAQLVERLNGIQEVRGSTPLISTTDKKTNPILSGSFSFRGLCAAMPCRLRREPLRADRKRREKQALAFAEIERSGHSQRLCDLSHECVALLLATNR